jgi:hypothetical protein
VLHIAGHLSQNQVSETKGKYLGHFILEDGASWVQVQSH